MSIEAQADKDAVLAVMAALGTLVPGCPGCAEFYKAEDPTLVFAPRHKASDRCESGKRAHCSCSSCF